MADLATQQKWDKLAKNFDVMAGAGTEKRWGAAKRKLFSQMGEGNILFLAAGTGLDFAAFPPNRTLTAIDISPAMLEQAKPRAASYSGNIDLQVMDLHELPYPEHHFDQIFTSCTFCSVPRPVEGLQKLYQALKPGGELLMFEHTGSRYFPFNLMLNLMTLLTSRVGPDMNRDTVANVRRAGFEIERVEPIFLDVVQAIYARKPCER